MNDASHRGILCVGDPHLCAWAPGYRKDDYSAAVLGKLRWALEHARQENLLPVLLGDLFHVPRDNANWMLAQLMHLFDGAILAVAGNHDLSEDALCENDSLTVLLAAGKLHRLQERPWVGAINGVPVAIGGTDNGQKIPKRLDRKPLGNPAWVFWITHHDIVFPGYEEAGYFGCREIPGVDLVINGHIHRELPDVTHGSTVWCNPGNIARVSRSDATSRHVPGVLRIDVTAQAWTKTRVDVPHQPFVDVFHPMAEAPKPQEKTSSFITGLQSMQKFKTSDGEGLRTLIAANLPAFTNERTRREILLLLKEVLPHARIEALDGNHRATAQAI